MASLDNDLTLHLALDEIQNGLAPDESANDNDGAVKGDPRLVPDELFGSCFDFDGTDDYVEVKDPFGGGQDFAVAVWLRPAALDDGQAHGALGFDAKPSLSLAPSGGALQFDYADAAQKQYTDRLANFFTAAGEWVHAAWVKEGTQFRFYRGGQLFDTREAAADVASDEKTGYCVGRADGFWKGQLAHARVYSRALTAEEIQQVMLDDQTAAAAFRKSHPIDFHAYDDDQQPVIVIDNGGPGKSLHFEIANSSQQSIELVTPASPTASSGNYHFALRFRPGALSSSSLSRVGPAAAKLGWGFFQEQRADGSVSLYFLQPTPPAGGAAAPGKSIVLTLPDVSAEAAGGSRGTRVELGYSQLRYVGASEQLSGSRAQHLEIISERGKRNVPLHVGFLGSNRVLNDGRTPNELKLRVTNTLADDPIALTPDTSDAPTTFTLSFDVQPDGEQREWALGTSDDVQGTHVSVVRRAEDNPHGSLALHLPLAAVEGGKTPAAAGQAGAVQGSPSPLPEDLLGGCLRFDGAKDFVQTADPFADRDNFTIAIWARPDALDDGSFHGMVGYQDSAGRKPCLWQAPSGGGLHYDSYDASKTRYSDVLAGFFTKPGEWVHVAWVKEGTAYRVYRNGKLYATRGAPQQFASDAKAAYWVGRVDNFWRGRLAHARVYSRALTDEEVQEVMLADQGLDAQDTDWRAKVVGLEGETPEWELTTTKTALAAGEMFRVRLRDFVSSLPSGKTDLYVRYKNLPGFWDGQFVVAAEKSPLVTEGQRVGVGVNNPRSALDTGLGLLTGAAADYQRAQAMLSGGGKVTWTQDGVGGRVRWSRPFVAASMGGLNQSFKDGRVNVAQPASNIPAANVWDGKDRPADAGKGVLLLDWEALYAVHRVGGGQNDVEFRIVLYTSPFTAASNWLLVAARNADDKSVRLGNGVTLQLNSSSLDGSPVPSGTIMMWSGKADAIPGGWALCDGNNGTPKLQDRFVVAATAASALSSGDADQHTHSYDIPPATFTTTSDGGHTHGFPGWYKRNMYTYSAVKDDKYSLIDSNGNDPKGQTTNGAGSHSHNVKVDYGPLNTAAAAAGRPAWFALCYIMKL
ncbi:MAG TPA: LamG-like jellyroll fold domain-containing protein [Pyrinomonadaceae bacterium]|nr:LamG-like jellyroll fold domain-containing protein [Pyrinomonadaceae bacterium]